MIIEKFNMYKDGGTIEVTTDKGTFCFDNRIGSETKGKLYNDYPKKDNSNLINDSKELENEIIEKLKVHKNKFYQSSINYLVEKYGK